MILGHFSWLGMKWHLIFVTKLQFNQFGFDKQLGVYFVISSLQANVFEIMMTCLGGFNTRIVYKNHKMKARFHISNGWILLVGIHLLRTLHNHGI